MDRDPMASSGQLEPAANATADSVDADVLRRLAEGDVIRGADLCVPRPRLTRDRPDRAGHAAITAHTSGSRTYAA